MIAHVLFVSAAAHASVVRVRISNVTVNPPVAKYAAAELVKIGFSVDVVGSANASFLDTVAEVCPHGLPGDCKMFSGGHVPSSDGAYAALSKVPTDASWWTIQPADLPVGNYATTLYVCEGSCDSWFKKPIVLTSFASSFAVGN
jgi:hypothetical protein